MSQATKNSTNKGTSFSKPIRRTKGKGRTATQQTRIETQTDDPTTETGTNTATRTII